MADPNNPFGPYDLYSDYGQGMGFPEGMSPFFPTDTPDPLGLQQLRLRQVYGKDPSNPDNFNARIFTPPLMPEQSARQVPIFGQTPQMGPFSSSYQSTSLGQPDSDQERFNLQKYLESYKPETGANDRLNQLLGNAPHRGGYRWTDALLGTSMALSGAKPDDVLNAMDRPYNQKVADWKLQVEPALKAAELERQANQNQMTQRYQAGTLNRYYDQLAETNRKNVANEGLRQEQVNINAKKQQLAEWRAQHPNWIPDYKSINLIYTNPQNPNERIDTGIPNNTISPMDRMQQEEKDREALARVRGEQARQTQKEKDNAAMERVQQNIAGRIAEIQTRAGASGSAELKPLQERQARVNRAKELIARVPELAEYIHADTTSNDVNIDTPTSGYSLFGGLSPEKHRAITEYIFGQQQNANLPDVGKEQTIIPGKSGGGTSQKGPFTVTKDPSTNRLQLNPNSLGSSQLQYQSPQEQQKEMADADPGKTLNLIKSGKYPARIPAWMMKQIMVEDPQKQNGQVFRLWRVPGTNAFYDENGSLAVGGQ